MNKLLKKSFLLLATMTATHCAYGQIMANLPLVKSDLAGTLTHFETVVQEPEVKKAIEHTQILLEAGVSDDSLASALINIEDLINSKLDECFFLNYKPYKLEMLLSLYRKTAALLGGFPPQGESLYYASALFRLAMMIMSYTPLENHVYYNTDSLMETAFRIREETLEGNHPDYLESLLGKAEAYHSQQNEKALPLLQQVISLSANGEGKAKKNYADALLSLGRIYTSMHRYGEAARILEQENAARKELLGDQNSSYALRLYATGDLILYTGEYGTSLTYFNKAIELTRKTLGEENLQYAFCLDGAGTVYYNIGAYKQAVPLYIQALAIKEKLHDYHGLPLALHQLATAYVRMGLYAQAQPLFERGCAIVGKEYAERGEAAEGYGYFLSHLASLYRVTHQYAKAYPFLRKAVDLTAPKDNDGGFFHSVCLQNLALLFQNTGHYDSALFYMKKVLSVKEKTWGKDHFQYASALHELSGLYVKLNQLDSALSFCQQAAAIRANKLGEEHAEYAASLALMGDLYIRLGYLDTAQRCLLQALDIREKSLGPEHPDYIRNLNSLARLAMAKGDSKTAALLTVRSNSLFLAYLTRTCESLSEQEKLNLINEEYDQFGLLPSLLYNKHSLPSAAVQQIYAAELLLKGMVLDNQQQVLSSIRRSKDSVAAALYFSWRANRAVIAKQYFLPVRERMPALDSLQEITNALEEGLSRRSALFQQQKSLRNLAVKDIGAALRTGEAAIEFIRFRYHHPSPADSILYSAIVVLPGDTTGTFVPLFEESQLKKILQPSATGMPWAIKKLYTGKRQQASDSLSLSLYRLIWKPMQKWFSGVHTIYFAPAGLLHRVAFAALRTENGESLLDKYNLNQVMSTRSLLFAKPTMKPSSVCLWATSANGLPVEKITHASAPRPIDKRINARLQPLPFAQQEIKAIEKVCAKARIHAMVVEGKMATEDSFKKFDGDSPETWHVATHGFFETQHADGGRKDKESETASLLKNAMLGSGLLMEKNDSTSEKEDGILTAYEMAQMDLSKTKLMVLSACNTALGDLRGEEGVLGLQRALKMAGVGQMIISLWKVPDKETAELMQAFYQAWLSGKDTRQALRTAQMQMKQKYLPFFWAAFVLVE